MRSIAIQIMTLTDDNIQAAIQEFAATYGVNQALYLVACALERLAEGKDSPADALIGELSIKIDRLASEAQRSAL